MTPTAIARNLRIPGLDTHLTPFWGQAMSAFPGKTWTALTPASIQKRRIAGGVSSEAEPLLLDIAARLRRSPSLLAVAWYLHWRQFVVPSFGTVRNFPPLDSYLGNGPAGAIYLLLALEFAPALARWHRQIGYPPDVTRPTATQVCSFEAYHRRGRGLPGMYASQFHWLENYLTGHYVRLGRFEYHLSTAGNTIYAWRHKRRQAIVALAADGRRFDSNGMATSDSDGWTATLRFSDNGVAGFPLAPSGWAIQKEVTLSPSEWEPFLVPGASVLNLHIPNGGHMGFENCRDSFRQAWEFFSAHHQDRLPVAITTTTWFLDPQLARLMPGSNPARLQSALYCHPSQTGTDGGLWFVYLDENGKPPDALPRDTALRRVLADFLGTGARWNGGSMFIPFNDAKNLRENRYAAWQSPP